MASSPRVTHGFLEGAAALFASYHAPRGGEPARNVAYVLCLPIHLDLIQSYRSMRRCAEELAAAGFHVMRIHYDGTGESIGATDRDPGRVAAWLESVRRAAAAMAAIPKVTSVGLLGVRLGGALALETSTHIDISHLILWEAAGGAVYSREMEILASSAPPRLAQVGIGADGDGTSPQAGFVAGGYLLSAQTVADLASLALETMQPRGTPHVLLVQRGDRKASPRLEQHLERLGCQVTAAKLAGHKEMMVMPQSSAVPMAILEAICAWAVEHSHVVEATADSELPVKLVSDVVVEGVRWRSIRLGSANHLFGVLTEPAGGAKAGLPAVLLLTGGATPRTAGNGSYVELARRLARKGHVVLRMDVASIGESGTADGSAGNGNDPFPPTILADARAGLERVGLAANSTKVWVLGLCSGAYAAFHTALEEPRTLGVFIINPATFYLKAPADTAPSASAEGQRPAVVTRVEQREQMQYYLQVMRDPASWKKLLAGKANVRHIVRTIRARVTAKMTATKESMAERFGRAPQGLAADLGKLLARGVKVNMVFSEGDPGHTELVAELGPRLHKLVNKGVVVKVFPGADHNFHEMTSRAELLDWLEMTITRP